MRKCSSTSPTTATLVADASTAGTNGTPEVVAYQVKYAPSVSMAPCPMLMTPTNPNTTASPIAASANTKVIRVESARTLSVVLIMALPSASPPAPTALGEVRGPAEIGSERQALATGVCRRDRIQMPNFLEHIPDARPSLSDLHQVGRQDHLVVEAAHLDLALRRLVIFEILQPVTKPLRRHLSG